MPGRFGQNRRIRRRTEFQEIYEKGARISGRYLTLFVLGRQGGPSRLGVTATKKLGSAVERNRAKRVVREVFRQSDTPDGFDLVVLPRRAMFDATFEHVQADFTAALGRRRHGRG